jgi:site-specific DNA-cytosine methylase
MAFLENVPGLLGSTTGDSPEQYLDEEPTGNVRYLGTILRDLSEAGYNARWGVLGADDVGAPHRRKRIWILAYTNGNNESTLPINDKR